MQRINTMSWLPSIKQILKVSSKYDTQTSSRKSKTATHIAYHDDVCCTQTQTWVWGNEHAQLATVVMQKEGDYPRLEINGDRYDCITIETRIYDM